MPSRRELANAIRVLSMDAVQKANSGHPGMPMGMADIAEVLWNDYLHHNPANPHWPNRDRFILSNGHGSMLQYALLHLSGYGVTIEDLQQFRQLHSKTPGHPEYGYTPGVETTTGPLGQGLANAVGMALAERTLAGQFNRPGFEIVDHHTYVFLGDGCMMEGISHEVCSLAGTWGLGKLIAFYDDNGISIDGEVHGWFTDNTPQRFAAYGWQVIADVDGHDADALKAAIDEARATTDRPTLICCKTIIGWGSPNKQGKEECHGAALGDAECVLVRETLGWTSPAFVIPDEVYAAWDAKSRGAVAESDWQALFDRYRAAHGDLAAEFERRSARQLPADWEEKSSAYVAQCNEKAETIASRKASQNAIGAYAPLLPELVGGSADLAGSNLTLWKGAKDINAEGYNGNYVYYGVREFGMAAIMNGMSLYGGLKPYGGTFLIFSDYARNGVRMSALLKTPVIYVFTHDSIGLGEDGPTHQPIEQVSTLRLIPNLDVWRPCDAVESAMAWKAAIERADGPSSLVFSRQNLPHMVRNVEQIASIRRGGYVLADCAGTPEVLLLATGSEIALVIQAAEQLNRQGRRVRVVSLPCTRVFDLQDVAYRDVVLPPSVTKRVAVEAGVSAFWHKYVGLEGKIIGIDRFGESAPGGELFKMFGFTVENVIKQTQELLG